MKALEGVRVLDLTQALSGPYCTMHLADFGAEVIKIEQPGKGELTRIWLPQVNGKSAYFTFANRNKKSLTLDLRLEEGRAIFLDLVAGADVVVDNYRGGTMQRYGLDYETLKGVNPRIIAASLSGYGNWGPMMKQMAFGMMAEAYSGFMDVNGMEDGPPLRSGNSSGDIFAGMELAFGITMALYHRERTGEGQFMDVAMMDATLQTLEAGVISTGLSGKSPRRIGNHHAAGGPYNAYQASDGWVVLGCPVWPAVGALCKAMGREDLTDNPKFANYKAIKQNEAELDAIIGEWVSHKTRQELEDIMQVARVPFAQVLEMKEVMEHPQTKAREMVVEVEDEAMGPVKMQGVSLKMSATPGAVEKSAPALGEHNVEILEALGIDAARQAELKEKKVI